MRFTDSGLAPEALTPGIDYRTAEALAREAYRATAPKASRPSRSPKEEREYEALCKRESELAALWKAFENGEPIPDYIKERKPSKATKETAVLELINQRWTARPPKDAELSAVVFLMDSRKADRTQLAKVKPGAVVSTRHGIGKVSEVIGNDIVVKVNRTKHRYNAPLAIAKNTIEII